jgi:two-component system sensor histidine kinase BaeS
VELSDLARTVAERFGAIADEKGVMLQVDAPQPVAVRGEPAALQRLIGNLVDNALRHTSGGEEESVRLSVEEDEGEAVVTVRDTGTGIGPEHLPHLFERFYRVDSARTRACGGAGLGLAIVKSIAEAHRGVVSVASELGHGSAFTLRLPAEVREKTGRDTPEGAATI